MKLRTVLINSLNNCARGARTPQATHTPAAAGRETANFSTVFCEQSEERGGGKRGIVLNKNL